VVVQGLIALALAGPTGGLFGLAYGTAIRVGYEIIYPLLFDQVAKDIKEGRDSGDAKLSANTEIVIGKMNTLYTSIGGLEANAFGVNTGIKNALKQIEDDPELLDLIKKNSNLLSQNITVNLSGTGLIDEQGRVVSKPLSAGLSEVEKIEAKVVVTEKIRIASDAVCRKHYGSKFSTAGFNEEGHAVTCQHVVGGVVQGRAQYPQATFSAPLPEKEKIDFHAPTTFTASEELWFRIFLFGKNEVVYHGIHNAPSLAWKTSIYNKYGPGARAFQLAQGWIQKNSSFVQYGKWIILHPTLKLS